MTGAEGGTRAAAALEAWAEWRARCALDACCAGARQALRAFAASRFRRMALGWAALAGACGGRVPVPSAADIWHLFETHFVVRGTRGGKRYKEWLFDRVRPGVSDPLDTVQGGATLLMRRVVREYLRRECAPPNFVSLHQPLGGDADGLALEDLLPGGPDPAGDAERREYERLSRIHAADIFDSMTCRERVAVLAKSMGVSLAHREVEKAAGCRKSVLSAVFRQFVEAAASRLAARYQREDRDAVRALVRLTLCRIRDFVGAWARTEALCGAILGLEE